MNEYYDTLIQEAKNQLQERQLMGAEAQGQFAEGMRTQRGQLRVYIKMREALLAEQAAVTSQIEAEKNQARQQFNNQLLNQVVGLLIQSPGGQRLLGQIREVIGNLREVAEGIQAAITENRPFDALAQAFASKVEDIPFLQNAAYNLGHAVGHKVDQLLGGAISRLDATMADFSGELGGALEQLNQMDAELANYQEQDRTPVSLIEEGGPLGMIRGVDRANAAIDLVVIDTDARGDVPVYLPVGNVLRLCEEGQTHRLRSARREPLEIGQGRVPVAARVLDQLDGFEEQMRACGGPRPGYEPNIVIHGDMGKSRGDLPQVLIKGLEAALLLDLAPGVREDRAIVGLDRHLVHECFGELLETPLGHIGPDAQDVGIIRDLDFRHGDSLLVGF